MKKGIFSVITLAVLLSTLIVGCGVSSSGQKSMGDALVTNCILPNSIQDNSLMGHWLSTDLPLKVSVHAGGAWSALEIEFLMNSANTWNSFYTASKGGAVFNYGTAASPNTSTRLVTSPDCSQTTPADGTVIYKRPVWTKGSTLIALTSFCTKSVVGGTLPIMYNGIIELNYQNYFVQTTGRFPDFQSIVTHELGHLLGLDHSCDSATSTRPKIACPSAEEEDPNQLRSTVMFPDWSLDSSGNGEIKRTLRSNDMGRANCLY